MRAIRPLAVLTAALLLTPLGVTSASAAEPGLQQARQEGALQTALALNRLLNPFKIEVAIQGQTARLQGEVENEVERERLYQMQRATQVQQQQMIWEQRRRRQEEDEACCCAALAAL